VRRNSNTKRVQRKGRKGRKGTQGKSRSQKKWGEEFLQMPRPFWLQANAFHAVINKETGSIHFLLVFLGVPLRPLR
jgi:hypothetical protein